MSGDTLKSDIIAGITVALVLVPQSMAYAQLAGMPAYYGLYAAFLPVIIASLWGSSSQLATGPVAVVSLLTASALTPLALPGSETFVVYAILLAFLVGVCQLFLGIFRLGVVINFLSHPVIVGFTNAAAIIIGLSQFNKLLGVSMVQSEHFVQDIWEVFVQIPETHIPTLLFGVSAFVIMIGIKKYAPRLPGVLIAVVLSTMVSFAIGFEQKVTVKITDLPNTELQTLSNEYLQATQSLEALEREIIVKGKELKTLNTTEEEIITKRYEIDLLKLKRDEGKDLATNTLKKAKQIWVTVVKGPNGTVKIIEKGSPIPEGFTATSQDWRIKKIEKGEVKLIGGGDVVGSIPEGLPSFQIPHFSWDAISTLLVTAFIISLVGFMEAISIAKAIATKTREPLDPNQELIGQGLANMVGSFTQSFPTSGSFSRSAVNFNAGAKTGFSSVITGIVVFITLLFLTPLLYHLPQSVLAAVIMVAVVGLINFKEIRHLWHTNRHDGIATIATFIATLVMAPHLDNGILLGGVLAIVLYLIRISKTRIYTCIPDKNHENRKFFAQEGHAECPAMQIVKIEGSLFFGAVAHAEKMLRELDTQQKYRLILAQNINFIDTAGAEFLVNEVHRQEKRGGKLFLCGLRTPVYELLQKGGYAKEIGVENIFDSKTEAIKTIVQNIPKEICKVCTNKIFKECSQKIKV